MIKKIEDRKRIINYHLCINKRKLKKKKEGNHFVNQGIKCSFLSFFFCFRQRIGCKCAIKCYKNYMQRQGEWSSLALTFSFPCRRGSMLSTAIFVYAATSPVNGYFGGSLYAKQGGNKIVCFLTNKICVTCPAKAVCRVLPSDLFIYSLA